MMLPEILPIIPEHRLYCEPFFGGGAVFWAKEPSTCEVINDVNMNVVNFYEVLKHGYFELKKLIEATLHSRDTYKRALMIYEMPELFADFPAMRAWAFYVCTNQGFASKVGTWGYVKKRSALTVQNKIDAFSVDFSERLKYVQVESNDAHKVMLSRDCADAFHYIDPPYVGSDCGHYGGYTDEHFKRDLSAIETLEGKFLLSSYPSALLAEYTARNGWHTKVVEKTLSASNGAISERRKIKYEVLTANYPI